MHPHNLGDFFKQALNFVKQQTPYNTPHYQDFHPIQKSFRSVDSDQQKLDAYFDAVRTAEQELGEIKAWQQRTKPTLDEARPDDVDDVADLIGRIKAMFYMVPLILETDSSRVVSVMIHDHGAIPQVQGVSVDHHNLSHHGQDDAKIG